MKEKMQNVRASAGKYVFRGTELSVKGLDADLPTEGWFAPEVPVPLSAYRRCYYAAWGGF